MSPKGFLLLVAITIFWGINWPIMKIAMTEIPVFTFRAIVLLGGGLCLFALCKAFGYPLTVPRREWKPLIAITIALFLFQILSGYGVMLTGSGRASVMAYTMPVWAISLGWLFLGEKPGWRRLTSLGLGMAGMVLLIVADIESLGGAPVGMILMLCTALAWSVATIMQKREQWSVPTLTLVAWQVILGAIPMCIGAAFFVDYGPVNAPGTWAILCTLYNIFVAAAFCFWAYMEVVRLYPVGVATIGVMLTPVVGIFSGAWILGEPLGVTEYGSMVLVSLAIGFPVFAKPGAWGRATRQA
ncbi:MAG: DMT family transporter [Alphaproteobacteria bacterium]|jgi:drug/metabolite transporter (DMT)-like permease|nr:DMT family transporter [Alphaproteobacteria bacterium]